MLKYATNAQILYSFERMINSFCKKLQKKKIAPVIDKVQTIEFDLDTAIPMQVSIRGYFALLNNFPKAFSENVFYTNVWCYVNQ